MYIGLDVKYPLFLPDFSKTCIFATDFQQQQQQPQKTPQIYNFIKIRPVGAKLFHADGQT